ncbi:hypothetical protein LWI29_007751 [Acer saccharum]|uniref:Uncharacterized protein n=1 Tax=Acer saccharum TaxID=4024 RepID=A0AA39RC72_ACESA|nr:hypothetical protein LWI29_007751 [Acer saccharum]
MESIGNNLFRVDEDLSSLSHEPLNESIGIFLVELLAGLENLLYCFFGELYKCCEDTTSFCCATVFEISLACQTFVTSCSRL